MRRFRTGPAVPSAAVEGTRMVVTAVAFLKYGDRAGPRSPYITCSSAVEGVLHVGQRGAPGVGRGHLALLDTDESVEQLTTDGGVVGTDVDRLHAQHGLGVDL